MSVDINDTALNNPLQSNISTQSNKDGYANVDVPPINGGTATDHINAIKNLTSVIDIQNYINSNIITPLKTATPPNLSGIDRSLVDLMATAMTENNNNNNLAAVLYHVIDNNLGYKLNIENQETNGQRKITLNSAGKNINDTAYSEIAKAQQNINDYNNTYFSSLNTSTTLTTNSQKNGQESTINLDTTTTVETTTPIIDPATATPATATSVAEENIEVSEVIKAVLPVDIDLTEFDDTLIIDKKTGKEINPKKYDLNDPKEAAEFDELMARSVTIQTNGKDEAVTDDANMQIIADALVEYITKPYETKISPDALEDILDNFSLEVSSEIFNLVQDKIIQSGNQAHIMKLRNYKNKDTDNGLDGIIGEMYNFNYLGGNGGNPLLFLSDMFASDTTYKLQSTNIDKIATTLSEHIKEYIDNMDSDDSEDMRKSQASLAFITQTIELLSTSHPDNLAQGNIDKLLQAINEKSGNNAIVKDILTDLATSSGVETFKTASIQTGQSLMSNFGEFTYTDANGNTKTFSSKDISGNFTTFKDDITQLLLGTHSSILSSVDKSNPQGDADAKAMTASQAADAIAMLSLEQQEAIIDELSEQDIVDLETSASFLVTPNENLTNIIRKSKTYAIVDDLNTATTTTKKAMTFAEGIETFTDKASPQEMTVFVSQIIQGGTDFLDLTAKDYDGFLTTLKTELTKIEGVDVELIINNLTNSLNVNKITFKDDISGEANDTATSLSATTLEDSKNIYLDAIEAGTLTDEQATAFINSISPEEKADSTFWSDIFADRTFASQAEFENFMKSISKITSMMSVSTDDMSLLKTNLISAISSINPEFATGATPTYTTAVISEPKTYRDHIVNLEKNHDADGSDDYKIIDELDIELDFATKLKGNNGDIIKTTDDLGKPIAANDPTNEEFSLYTQSMVNYVLETYADKSADEKAIELYKMMDTVASKLDNGNRSGVNEEMLNFLRMMGAAVKAQPSGTFNIGLIHEHILIGSNETYAEVRGGIKHNRDDNKFAAAQIFSDVANGKNDIVLADTSALEAPPPPPVEETTDDTGEAS